MTNVSDGIVNQDGSEVQPSTIYARVNRHIMTIVENMFINRRKVMYIPAERIGINTFRKEIGDSRKRVMTFWSIQKMKEKRLLSIRYQLLIIFSFYFQYLTFKDPIKEEKIHFQQKLWS